jgi:hypothetical protein
VDVALGPQFDRSRMAAAESGNCLRPDGAGEVGAGKLCQGSKPESEEGEESVHCEQRKWLDGIVLLK